MRCWWKVNQSAPPGRELCRSATLLGGLRVGFVAPRSSFPSPGAGGTAQDPPHGHSGCNGIEEAAASPRRDLAGLRFQTGFGAGA